MTTPQPEYLRLRAYLYNLAMKHLPQGGKLPSENELSVRFGVSRVTVRGAIQGLIKDRLLFSRRGMGTYVNPHFSLQSSFQAIGMMVNAGANVTDHVLMEVLQAIQMCGMHGELLFMPESKRPGPLLEQVRFLDGIIWSISGTDKPPLLDDIVRSQIPVLAYCHNTYRPEHCDCLHKIPEKAGNLLGKTMLDHGHTRLLTITDDQSLDHHLAPGSTYHAAYAVMHPTLPATHDAPPQDICQLTELPDRLRRPDFLATYSCLYSSARIARNVMKHLDAANLSVPDQLSYLVYGESLPQFFHGRQPAAIRYRQSAVENLVTWLTSIRKRTPGSLPFHQNVTFSFQPGDTMVKRT